MADDFEPEARDWGSLKDIPTLTFSYNSSTWKAYSDETPTAISLMSQFMNLGVSTVSNFEHFILPTHTTAIFQMPTDHPDLGSDTYFYLFADTEFSEFYNTGLIPFRDLVPNDLSAAAASSDQPDRDDVPDIENSDYPSDKYIVTLMASTPGMALAQANLIGQKGFKHSETWFLFAWRPQKDRLRHLINENQIQITNRGAVRGASILVNDFIVTRTEARNAAVLKLRFNLKNFHDLNYRSNEAFRTGQVRNFGLPLSPLSRPSTKFDRDNVAHYLCFQGIGVLSDRFRYEQRDDPNSIPKTRALKYFWQNESETPTLICPTALIEHVSSSHQRAYKRMNFDLKGTDPKFISDFYIDELVEALDQIRVENWKSKRLAEMD